MSTDLVPYEGFDALVERYGNMSERDLRLLAKDAANRRAADELWKLTKAYVGLKGRKKTRVSEKTLDSYRIGLDRLLKHWRGENLLRPSRDAGDRYVGELAAGKHGDRPLDPGTIQVRIAAARALYKALRWADATAADPFDGVEVNTSGKEDVATSRTAYKDAAVDKLLEKADELGAVIVLLGADGGLRAQEMLDLLWVDINFAEQRLRVRSGKGRKPRWVEASPDLIDALRAWKSHAPADRVFPFDTTAAARYRMRELCKQADVKYLALHSLRHASATRLYRETNDLNVAREHLGHADLKTTLVYAHMDRSTLKAAVGRWHRPRAAAAVAMP